MSNSIKEKRKAAKLTQSQLAAALGVAPITVSFWEQGRRNPSQSTKKLMEIIFSLNPKNPID